MRFTIPIENIDNELVYSVLLSDSNTKLGE